jgi:hypothetical protein
MKEDAVTGRADDLAAVLDMLRAAVGKKHLPLGLLLWVAQNPKVAAVWLERAPRWPLDIANVDLADLGRIDHVAWSDLEQYATMEARRQMDPALSALINQHLNVCTLCLAYVQIRLPRGPEPIQISPPVHHSMENRLFQDFVGTVGKISPGRALGGSWRDDQ